jgi:threonine/homoserine/homoserine lactone efflux protein
MSDLTHAGIFVGASLALLMTPGPAVLYIVTRSIGRGRRAGLVSVLGICTGTLVHVVAAALGLSALLVSSALAFNIVRWLGALYLVVLGIRTLLDRDGLSIDVADQGTDDLHGVFMQGVIVNVLNPHTALFFFAFLPQFVSTEEPHALSRMLELSGVFMLLTFVVFLGYGVFAASVRNHIISRPRVLTWMRRSFAAAFAGLGLKLALADRT